MSEQQSQTDAMASESSPIAFQFEAHSVRTVPRHGEIWFVATDVCEVLEHSDASKAVSRLDEDEKGTTIVRTIRGEQEVNIINESGLYSLILTSRKPQAKAFKRWVTKEMLPSIRKTGRYDARRPDESPFEPKPTRAGGFHIVVPDYGRYTVTIKVGGDYHIHRNEYESLIQDANELDCAILSHALKTIEAFWYKTQHLRSLDIDPASGGFAMDNLESAILQGAKIAGQYLQIQARGLYKLDS